jgi:hypothetical protein
MIVPYRDNNRQISRIGTDKRSSGKFECGFWGTEASIKRRTPLHIVAFMVAGVDLLPSLALIPRNLLILR